MGWTDSQHSTRGAQLEEPQQTKHLSFAKWLWRFSSEERAIWRRFIAEKYGLLNHWTTEEVAGTFGCSVWKTIRRLWPHVNNNISITVGNGLKTDFWNEVWIGKDNLRNSFSHLYTLSTQRNVSVSQAWSQKGWDLVFRRALNDWEIGEVANLLGVLNSHPALSMRPNKPRWILHNKGVFTMKVTNHVTGILTQGSQW